MIYTLGLCVSKTDVVLCLSKMYLCQLNYEYNIVSWILPHYPEK